jgi:hypothetical protein
MMKIARKAFRFPATRSELKEVETGLFWRVKRTVRVEEPLTFDEVQQMVQTFVDGIGHDKVVSISERTQALDRIGDDRLWVCAVWYWQESEK